MTSYWHLKINTLGVKEEWALPPPLSPRFWIFWKRQGYNTRLTFSYWKGVIKCPNFSITRIVNLNDFSSFPFTICISSFALDTDRETTSRTLTIWPWTQISPAEWRLICQPVFWWLHTHIQTSHLSHLKGGTRRRKWQGWIEKCFLAVRNSPERLQFLNFLFLFSICASHSFALTYTGQAVIN